MSAQCGETTWTPTLGHAAWIEHACTRGEGHDGDHLCGAEYGDSNDRRICGHVWDERTEAPFNVAKVGGPAPEERTP